jgi:hypothetical protein
MTGSNIGQNNGYTDIHGFPHSLQPNTHIVSQIWPQPFPLKSPLQFIINQLHSIQLNSVIE